MQEGSFWGDQERATRIAKEREDLANEITEWEGIDKKIHELVEMAQLYEKEKDAQPEDELTREYAQLAKEFSRIELTLFFSGEHDTRDAFVTIHAGSGGTDAQDWAQMLERMYLRFFEKQGWRSRVVEESRGKEAGLKRVMLEVQGRYVYGMMKCEAGVHRLVRISPFDAEKMRHTSFALLEVTPSFDEVKEIQIDDKDIRIDTSTSSGHGGQSVNTTYSAIRVVHIPTGITVSCQNERSQKQNKETAMKILRSKLFMLELQKQQKEKQDLRGEFKSAEWGNQIRSYVLHPYTMVKDHRTKFETGDVYRVLDGDVLLFIEAQLRAQSSQ